MRVLGIAFFASAGGDFHPLVAAAAGLRARGHHVQLLCDPEGARLVVETGIGTVVDEEAWAAAPRRSALGGEHATVRYPCVRRPRL